MGSFSQYIVDEDSQTAGDAFQTPFLLVANVGRDDRSAKANVEKALNGSVGRCSGGRCNIENLAGDVL